MAAFLWSDQHHWQEVQVFHGDLDPLVNETDSESPGCVWKSASSDDGGRSAFSGSSLRSRRVVLTSAAGALFLFTTAAMKGRWAIHGETLAPTSPDGLAATSQDWSLLGMGIDGYEKAFGGVDPFKFSCPLPGLAALQASKNSTAGEPRSCCAGYDSLGWPYQFPDCKEFSDCRTCRAHSPNEDLKNHPAAPLAGLAWAASLAVYSAANPTGGWLAGKVSSKLSGFLGGALHMGGKIGDAALKGRRIRANIGIGLHDEEALLCPNIGDWEQTMLNDDKDNIQARLFKSKASKVAVVVFRGTQMTSMKNWEVDANLIRTKLKLGGGFPDTEVHEGFLNSLQRVLPRVKTWLNGYMLGMFDSIPHDWTVLFTGHSLGGALAMLAATLAEVDDWDRKPSATVVFGAPRVADATLGSWWKSRGMCPRLLRVNTYNDVIHYMPLKTAFKWWEIGSDIMKCVSDIQDCMQHGLGSLMQGTGAGTSFSDRWDHICGPESEFVVESSVKGVNKELEHFSPMGGAMAHFIDNCYYGYSYGVLRSGLVDVDRYCGITPNICPARPRGDP